MADTTPFGVRPIINRIREWRPTALASIMLQPADAIRGPTAHREDHTVGEILSHLMKVVTLIIKVDRVFALGNVRSVLLEVAISVSHEVKFNMERIVCIDVVVVTWSVLRLVTVLNVDWECAASVTLAVVSI